MNRPRFRFSVRWMMVAVVFFALASLGWREYRARMLRNNYRDPVFNSQIGAETAGRKMTFLPDRTVPVTITYNIKLSRPKPGVSCLVLGLVWLEDMSTGRAVDSYSFDVKLTGGEREACSGTITWDAIVPKPGRYMLRYHRYQQQADGELWGGNGGGTPCEFIPEAKP